MPCTSTPTNWPRSTSVPFAGLRMTVDGGGLRFESTTTWTCLGAKPPAATDTVVVPSPIAVTNPLPLTVATAGSALPKDTPEKSGVLVPLLYWPVTESVVVSPAKRSVGFAIVTTKFVITTMSTVIGACTLLVLNVAVSVATPLPCGTMRPALFTEATPGLPDE